MSTSNFLNIETKLLKFKKGTCYRFVATIDIADGYNPVFSDDVKPPNNVLMVREWYIHSEKQYKQLKPQMQALCDITGARLYLYSDRIITRNLLMKLQQEHMTDLQDVVDGRGQQILDMYNMSPALAVASMATYCKDEDAATYCITIPNDKYMMSDVCDFLENNKDLVVTSSRTNCQIIAPRSLRSYLDTAILKTRCPKLMNEKAYVTEGGLVHIYLGKKAGKF